MQLFSHHRVGFNGGVGLPNGGVYGGDTTAGYTVGLDRLSSLLRGRKMDLDTRVCPFCERPLGSVGGADGWKQRDFREFAFAAGAPAVQPGVRYERRRPARSANIESDVAVPGVQALITGLIGGIAGGIVAMLVHAPKPWAWGLAIGVITTAVTWILLLVDHRQLLWEIEEVIGRDLDDDGIVGDPDPPAPEERLILVHDAGRHHQVNERARFEAFIRGCEVHGTSQNYWEGPGRLEREEYLRWRDALIRLGWAKWRNPRHPRQGWVLLFPAEEIISGMFRSGSARASKER